MSRTGRLTPLRAESDELLHLDALRFIAATGIVVYHFRLQLDARGFGIVIADLESLSLFVDLFFFISGFVITRFYGVIRDASHYGDFLWKRIARLYPLHLATAAIFIAIGIAHVAGIIQLRLSEQFDFHCLPANLLLLHSAGVCQGLSFNPVSWSISAEMMLYASLPLLLLVRKRGPAALVATALILIAILSWFAGWGSPRPWYSWTYDFGILRAMPSFLLGMAAYDLRARIGRIPAAATLLWLFLFVFAVLLLEGAQPALLLALLYATVICGVAADQQGETSGLVRALAPLGLLTYSLYMLHPVVDIVALSFVGRKLLGLSGIAFNLWLGLCFISTYVLAYLSLQLFESPARAWLTGWRKGRTAVTMPKVDQHTPL